MTYIYLNHRLDHVPNYCIKLIFDCLPSPAPVTCAKTFLFKNNLELKTIPCVVYTTHCHKTLDSCVKGKTYNGILVFSNAFSSNVPRKLNRSRAMVLLCTSIYGNHSTLCKKPFGVVHKPNIYIAISSFRLGKTENEATNNQIYGFSVHNLFSNTIARNEKDERGTLYVWHIKAQQVGKNKCLLCYINENKIILLFNFTLMRMPSRYGRPKLV
jgi:hypothetical protein